MRSYVLFSVVCLQLGWTYGEPAGVGVYAYQDSAGNRYGGKFDLDDAQVFAKGKNPNGANSNPGGWGPFAPPFMPNFQPFAFDEFFPEYFSNLENLLHEAFNQNLKNQRLAFNAAKKAYDLTSNQAGYIPHSPGRFDNFGGFGDFSSYMPRGGQAAYAGAAAGPGFTHQVAAISPENPNQENVNMMSRFAETPNTDGGKYYSVSSSSFASSSNVNGERQGTRSAETVVNNNGQITRYKVHS